MSSGGMGIRGGLKRIIAGLEVEIAPAVFVAAQGIEAAAAISITTGSVSGNGHVASAPGQPPNNDTGVLARGIETTQPEPARALVTSSAPYAAAQEFGTSKLPERPYMRPAVAVQRKNVIATITRAVNAAVRKLGSAS